MDATIAALLPTLTAAAASLNSSLQLSVPSPSSTLSSSSASTNNTTPDDLDLKRSWLHLLPHEQVVSIVLRLDEYAPPGVRSEIWPSDIRAAVRTLSELGKVKDKEVANVGATGSDSVEQDTGVSPSEVQASEASDRQDSPSTDVDETPATTKTTATAAAMGVQQVPVVSLPPPTSTAMSPPLPNGLLVGSPAPTAASPTSLPVPPLAPPPPGVNTGISPGIQGHMPYPYAVYPTYAGANPSYPFNIHSLLPPAQNVQKPQHPSQHPPPPHPFPFGPLSIPPPPPGSLGPPQPPPPNNGPFTRAPLPPPVRTVIPPRANIPPHPQPKGPSAEDLPSYEEMIVQALIDLGATDANAASEGVVPKQVFQWMAERYPLQQNFRPSASQALQKAYKRGRFEKNRDGRYRLNLYWEGANTAKRATRRPQSQLQAEKNPHPSSHPPPPKHPYPHPRYGWYPPPGGADGTPPQNGQNSSTSQPQNGLQAGDQPGQGQDHDPESAREAWEAAQNILQALNITALLQQAKAQSTAEAETASNQPATDGIASSNAASVSASVNSPKPSAATATAASSAVPFPPPIFAGDISLGPAISSVDGGGLALPSPAISTSATTKTQAHNHQAFANPLLPQDPLLPSSANVGPSTGQPVASTTSVLDPALMLGPPSGRAALQGSLALLAAQLADIAGAEDEDPNYNYLTHSSTDQTANTSAMEAMVGLEALLGMNWSAGLKGLDVQS